MAKKKKSIDRRVFKKEGEELQAYLQFQRKGGKHKDNKKYNRKKIKRELDKFSTLYYNINR